VLFALGFFLFAAMLPRRRRRQLQGTVTDASSALILERRSRSSMCRRQQFSDFVNEVGFFVFPSLQPGEYRLTVNFAGMDKWQGQITLQVGQRRL